MKTNLCRSLGLIVISILILSKFGIHLDTTEGVLLGLSCALIFTERLS